MRGKDEDTVSLSEGSGGKGSGGRGERGRGGRETPTGNAPTADVPRKENSQKSPRKSLRRSSTISSEDSEAVQRDNVHWLFVDSSAREGSEARERIELESVEGESRGSIGMSEEQVAALRGAIGGGGEVGGDEDSASLSEGSSSGERGGRRVRGGGDWREGGGGGGGKESPTRLALTADVPSPRSQEEVNWLFASDSE